MKKKVRESEKCWYKDTLIMALFLTFSFAGAGEFVQKDVKPHIVFLVSEDPNNYKAHKTIPKFAELLRNEHDFKVSVLLGSGDLNSYKFPNMKILSDADLVVVFFRRIALETNQMDIFKDYLDEGKPLIGIRTANHAFSVRNGEISDGFEQWWDFVPKILGCENRGYGPVQLGTDVSIVSEAKNDPILKGIEPDQWHSNGNIYHVAPLIDEDAKILLQGTVEGKSEPIAWTRTAENSPIFYTSLGHPDDFKTPQFMNLLINAIQWTLKEDKLNDIRFYEP